ncbi:hypothetical protein BT93_L0455 [Corymbia citriodora subsp. variegata]|uniref:phosphomevalonate kinase n=1 Tax=Corymbia citriodora subsp. variegata TaxID=360336 RepID=A0A8T0CEQ3_CORYI|nr:hypothetical protein BT93_L0455 [Corymbia citriodora subsp. variegata]
MTAALLYYHTSSGHRPLDTKVVHNLAQAAHCAAQGKVGSGFDVAAAVYGSCLYRRFSPAILESIGEMSSDDFANKLKSCVDDTNPDLKWDTEIQSQAVRIPDNLVLMMCDVDCGSETPSLVRGILAWRKQKPEEADTIWNEIQKLSESLCAALRGMAAVNGDTPEVERRDDLKDIIFKIRERVRDMTNKSGVPVEPGVITQLLDYCSDIPGVVGGVAPGAGGYDAVALLVQADSEVERDLRDRLLHFKAREDATGVTIGRVRLLDVKQAHSGVEIEDVDQYKDWS